MADPAYTALMQKIAAGATPWKLAVRVVSTSNITLTGLQTIDGVTVAEGDRVLAAGQTSAAENGIYAASGSAWTRTPDMDRGSFLQLGTTIRVLEGTLAALWVLSSPTNGTVRVGVTALVFSSPSVSESLYLPLVLDRDKIITATADAIGKIAIIPATSGHVAGTTAIVNIDANELAVADDLIVGSDLDPEATWDTLDPTRAYTIGITVTDAAGAGKFVTSGKVQERTASAPTIVSAVVASGNPNALVVTWSAPVYLPDLTGLSLTFSAGTSRTITARESCNAAATEWTLTLSGNFDGTEVCNLVVGASRTARAANGTLVTAETEAINVSFAANWTMPSQENFWRGDDMATSGSNVTAVTDQTGSDDMATPGSDLAVVSNIGSTSRTGFKPTGAGSYLEADFSSRDMSTGFCLFMVLRVPSHAALTCVYLASGRNGAPTTSDCLLYETGGNLIDWRTNGSDDCAAAFSATVLVDIMLQVDPGGTAARLYIDGALVDTELADVSTNNISRWTIGALPDHSLPATNIEYGEVRIGRGTTYDGDDATDGHAYRLAYYV